jgi:hypothetical protein
MIKLFTSVGTFNFSSKEDAQVFLNNNSALADDEIFVIDTEASNEAYWNTNNDRFYEQDDLESLEAQQTLEEEAEIERELEEDQGY